MNTTTSTLVRPAVSIGTAAMARLGDAGLFRRGVPTQLGGDGGSIADVTATARELQRDDQAAAWIFRVQRHAIELLVHAENAGLREFLLPQWLQGERAGTVPLDANSHPLLATPVGNALRLYGQYRRVVNLQWIGFSVVVPVQVASAVEWVVVRGEEDRLRVGIDQTHPCPPGSCSASLTFDGVFFRMDEWLGGASSAVLAAPLAEALANAVPIPMG